MADSPNYLVNIGADMVTLRIEGRASYLNCAPVRKLFEKLIPAGTQHFVIDFVACSNMDSTFLGILAGAALEIRKTNPKARIELCRLSERNMELVQNLGLHRLMDVKTDEEDLQQCQQGLGLDKSEKSVDEKDVLKAHENLIRVDKANEEKFQDVVAFLKKQVEQE